MCVAVQLGSQESPALQHDALDGLQPEYLRGSYADQIATLAQYALSHGEPEILVLAGVHGREDDGSQASLELLLRLADRPLYGRIGVIPVCSPPAFAAETHFTPVSDRYMARAFAPDAPRDLTEALSHAVLRVAQRADVLLNPTAPATPATCPTRCAIANRMRTSLPHPCHSIIRAKGTPG